MTRKRMHPETRRADILRAALPLAAERGFQNLTRRQVAEAAGVTGPAVSYHFGEMDSFRAELIAYAVAIADLAVVGQGLAARHPAAMQAPDGLKRRAAAAMAR